MTKRSRVSLGVLVFLSIALVLFGVSDLTAGPGSDPASTQALVGQSPDEVRAAEPTGFRLYDFAIRSGGLNLLFIGLLLTSILVGPYRAGSRWAWTTMWLLPAWSLAVPALMVGFGTAPGTTLPASAISGPIIALIAGGALVLDRGRFGIGTARVATLGAEPA